MNLADLERIEAELDGKSYALDEGERKLAEVAKRIVEKRAAQDAQLAERLRAEADGAMAQIIGSGYDGPIRAIYNVNAHRLSGGAIGWLVMGPTDKGKATKIMKEGGSYKAGEGIKVIETNPDVFIPTIELSVLAAPNVPEYPIRPDNRAARQQIGRALTDVPEWARAVYNVATTLAGSEAQETGKGSGG